MDVPGSATTRYPEGKMEAHEGVRTAGLVVIEAFEVNDPIKKVTERPIFITGSGTFGALP